MLCISSAGIFVGVLGIEFVDFLFKVLLLVEGTGGFLHTVFVGFYLGFDLLDALRVTEPVLDAVESLGTDAAIHQYVVILDVGDSGLFDAGFLPDESGAVELRLLDFGTRAADSAEVVSDVLEKILRGIVKFSFHFFLC